MLGLIDYHTHTVLSDGNNTHEEMVKAAIEKGLSEIGFTDHVCIKDVEWGIDFVDIPVMSSQINYLKEKYKKYILVKYGIELDYFAGHEIELSRIINKLPLDYVIGSVHFIDDWNFDSDKSLYGKWSNDELYQKYFKIVQQLARSNLFDIIGHFDIIKKFNVIPETNQQKLYEETLKVIKDSNCVVELNTGGLDRECKEFTPSETILKICYDLQIPITLSSDAHSPKQIGRHYVEAIHVLKKIGFNELVKYTGRKRSYFKI